MNVVVFAVVHTCN